jgi:hypothetical protein
MTAASRERVLKIALVLFGLPTFIFAAIPVVQAALQVPRCTSSPMLNAVLATLGVFMVLAARSPSAHRSLILFTAWSGLAHGAVMAVMAIRMPPERAGLLTELWVSAALAAVVAVVLLLFAPPPSDQATVAVPLKNV